MSVIQGLKATNLYLMKVQLKALELEIDGIRGKFSMYAHIKRVYGLRGNRQRVCDQFAQLVKEAENQ